MVAGDTFIRGQVAEHPALVGIISAHKTKTLGNVPRSPESYFFSTVYSRTIRNRATYPQNHQPLPFRIPPIACYTEVGRTTMTRAQRRAAIQNAPHSTGPRDAVRHNLSGTVFVLLPGEDRAALEALLHDYTAEWKPRTPHQTFAVAQMV